MQTITLNVDGMTCSNCEKAIKRAVHELDGIGNVTVDLDAKAVTVVYEPDSLTPDQIKSAIEGVGYEVK